jgi:lysophospholipase L1-like esterase
LHIATVHAVLVFFWEGGNDILGTNGYTGVTGRQALDNVKSAAAIYRNKGCKVVIPNLWHRADLTAEQNGYVDDFNTLLDAEWQTFCDGIVDHRTGIELRSDGVHPTDAGQQVLGARHAAVVQRFLAQM